VSVNKPAEMQKKEVELICKKNLARSMQKFTNINSFPTLVAAQFKTHDFSVSIDGHNEFETRGDKT
jgi:hypothetical protein